MKTTIVKKKDFGLYSHFTIHAPEIAKQAKPGQFVEVKITGEQMVFWRRPFCICRAQDETIELLVKEVGTASGLMREKKVKCELDIIGPLGNGFDIHPETPALLVGGGFGVAPLLFLAQKLKEKKVKVNVLIGGRCEEDLLLRKEMHMAGAEVACATNDGSYGVKGLVTLLVEKQLVSMKEKPWVYTAGPLPMMAAVTDLAKKHDVACQVSLEEVMACGLGICNGCVVNVAGQYQRVCKDGPVFNGHEVEWEKS